MEIKLLEEGHLIANCNCYGLLTESAAVVIDPGKFSKNTFDFLNDNADKERLILITHAHYDHIGGAKELREKTGVKIAVGENEADALHDGEYNLSAHYRKQLEPFCADITLGDGEKITVGDVTFKTIFTPGHSKGGVCYLAGDILFSGDTLFYETVGRTDLPGGGTAQMQNSLAKLVKLDDFVKVYPGHGENTTIGHERNFNPYMR